MEDLMSQFTMLSDQALRDKNFDPSTIEDLMKLFEIEAQKSWAAMESELQKEEEDALNAMAEAEAELEAAMDDAMEDFRRFEEEREIEAMAEYRSLRGVGDAAGKMGQMWEKSATAASEKYIQAALNSANNSMKSASKGLSNAKVHPS
uniref:Uncharacterized protein n=2 Tax=Opuntia streptacantha TaxID=393608 RepID=A0A7C9CDG0_OPUST